MHTLISATPSPYARKVRIALAEKGIPFTLQTEVPWDSTTQTPQYNPLEKLPVLILDPSCLPKGCPIPNSDGSGLLGPAIYESHFILAYLEAYYNSSSSPPYPSLLPSPSSTSSSSSSFSSPPHPALLPSSPNAGTGGPESDATEARLFAQQVELVADGICDALVLAFWERNREEDKQSQPWIERQMRKVDGGLGALEGWVERAVSNCKSGYSSSSQASTDGEGRKYSFLINNSFSIADIAIGSVLGYLAVRWPEHPWRERHPVLAGYWRHLEERESFKSTVPTPQVAKDRIV